jgi:hypothetical protein
MEQVLQHPAFWIVLACVSELIAISPAKENSVVQLLLSAINSLKGKKR